MLLLGKLCASFPATPDAEVTIEAYREETADIPVAWLREGLRRFRDDPGRTFLPSVAEVRTACAMAVREARRAARGEAGYSATSQDQLDVSAMLGWARKHAPIGLAQVAAIEGPRAKRRLAEVSNQRAEQAERGGPRGRGAGESVSEVIRGLRVVDEQGRAVPVLTLAEEIAKAGILVPPMQHADRAFGMQGRWLASCIALERLGHRPVSSEFVLMDWERADRAMKRHRDEAQDADTAWWFDRAREDWWRIAKRNKAAGGR